MNVGSNKGLNIPPREMSDVKFYDEPLPADVIGNEHAAATYLHRRALERIASLEKQVAELTARLDTLEGGK